MSLPTIQKIFNLKDLGNIVENVKGTFPFVLNEKQQPSFEQEWVELLDFDSKPLSYLEIDALLDYSDEDTHTQKQNVDDVNQLIDESPTEAGDGESNQFRKGIEGVYRLMGNMQSEFSKVESHGHGYQAKIAFVDAAHIKINALVPTLEKILNEVFQALPAIQQQALDVANPANVAIAAPMSHIPLNAANQVNAANPANPANPDIADPIVPGHRTYFPQQVILPPNDLDGFEDGDIAALFDGYKEPIRVEDIEALLPDGNSIAAEDVSIDLDAISDLLAAMDDAPTIPARDDDALTENEAPLVPARDDVIAEDQSDAVDLDAISELLAAMDDAPTIPARDDDALTENEAPLVPARDDDAIFPDAGITIEHAEDVQNNATKISEGELPPPPNFAVGELPPPPNFPVGELPELKTVDHNVINELLEHVKSDNVEVVDHLAVDGLLTLTSDVPAFTPPTPPPMPVNGVTSKPKSAIEPTNGVQVSTDKPKLNADKPDFSIKPNQFSEQYALMKAKAAEKAAAKLLAEQAGECDIVEVPVKSPSSLLEQALTNAMISRPKSELPNDSKDTFSSDDGELDVWELEELQDANVALIKQHAKTEALSFDLNGFVNGLLATRQESIKAVIDNYEVKLNSLPCVTRLTAEQKANAAVADGIIDATDRMQQKVVESIKTHAMSISLGVIQNILITKMNDQFKVHSLTSKIDTDNLDKALSEALENLEGATLERMKVMANEGISEVLAADAAYLENATQPSTFDEHCRKGVDGISQGLTEDAQALNAIINAEGLGVEAVKSSVVEPSDGGGLFAALKGHLFGRREAISGTQDIDDDSDFEDDSIESSKSTVSSEADAVSPASPFSFSALKSLLGEKLGSTKGHATVQDEQHADTDAVNELLDVLSPQNSGYLSSGTDQDTVDGLLDLMSPVNSGYLSPGVDHGTVDGLLDLMSPVNSGYLSSGVDNGAVDDLLSMLSPLNSAYLSTNAISESDVFQDASGSIQETSVASPVVLQQFTETHDTATESVFGL